MTDRDTDRGTGRTSQQMREAAHGALFFVPSGLLCYAQRLAVNLGRSDLQIVAQHNLRRNYFAGKRISGLVLDHAIELTPSQSDAVEYAQPCIMASRNPSDQKQQIPEERMINAALVEVENLGTHPTLTDVSTLLIDAQRKLAEWHDAGRPGEAQ